MKTLPDKKDDILSKLITSDHLESPAPGFTNDVLGKLNLAPAPERVRYSPVISSKGWIFIGVLCAVIFFIAFKGTVTQPVTPVFGYLDNMMLQFESFIGRLAGRINLVFWLIPAATMFLLFLIDSLYRQNRLRVNKISG